MKSTAKGIVRTLATRGVIAVLPVAIASAYASGVFLESPRSSELAYVEVAEITVAPNTVGIADSSLVFMSQADINKTLDQLQAIGVNNIRVLVPWATIETSDNVYNWTQIDMVMKSAAARNMGVMADINSTPLWAAPPNTYPGAGTPPISQFTSFVQQVATKYGSTISAYEIWNEPNFALFYQPINPVSYTALLKAAYPVIKNIDPTASVVAGALGAGQTTGLTMNPVDFVSAMMNAGAGNYFDAFSFHPYQESLKFSAGYTYPGLGTPLEQLDAIKSLIGTAKSVWISEYGLPTSSVSQQQQSDYIKDLLDYWQGYSQAGPVFLYTTKDGTAGGSSLSENSFGLYNANWTPKIAAEMLKAWIKAHPTQNPGTPTTPTPPSVDPVAAYFAAVAAQYAAAIAAYVAALHQAVAAWAAPAAVAAPMALRVAAVETPEAALLAAEPTTATVEVAAAPGEDAKALEAAVAPAEAVTVGVTPVAEEVPAAEAVVTTPETTVPAPEATEPEVVTVPEVKTPEVTTPEVKTPEVTTPEVKTPEVTTPEVKTPASEAAPAAPSAPAATPKDADSPSKPADDGSKTGAKQDDTAKSGDADTSATDKPARSPRHAKVKGDKGTSVADIKSKVAAESATASAGAVSAPAESVAAG